MASHEGHADNRFAAAVAACAAQRLCMWLRTMGMLTIALLLLFLLVLLWLVLYEVPTTSGETPGSTAIRGRGRFFCGRTADHTGIEFEDLAQIFGVEFGSTALKMVSRSGFSF